jgi:hypothetical protein
MNNTIKTDKYYIDFLAEIKERIRHSGIVGAFKSRIKKYQFYKPCKPR